MIDLGALLHDLCAVTPDRRPGSAGNEAAVDLVAGVMTELGWPVQCPRFPVVDWEGSLGTLTMTGRSWSLHPSPYSLGWQGTAPVRLAATEADLAEPLTGCAVLLHGELAATPLTPKGYPFYGSERDARIIERLESSGAVAVLAVTGRSPELAGSLDPFPLIEDGTFTLPTGNIRQHDGADLLDTVTSTPGTSATIDLPARRWPATARNVIAHRGDQSNRITVVAHIDTKPGTPGAIDNGTGVVVLCRVAELLADSPAAVELLAVNGEDCYSASGELDYLAMTDLSQVRLAINIDGLGYRGGPSAYSTYGTPDDLDLTPLVGLEAGPQWPQSDHMVFVGAGRPAIALTSSDFPTVMNEIAHSPEDTPDVVDLDLVEQAAQAIAGLVGNSSRE